MVRWIVIFAMSFTACAQSCDGHGLDSGKWAKKIELEGVENLHKIDANLYRSAQPTREGMRKLEKMGIKTVVNLRSFHSDRDEIRGTELKYVHIYCQTWNLEDEDAIEFLKVVSQKENGPFLVHCWHGADRTGMMCAIYRIAIQEWSKEEAIREMRYGGFGFHEIWSNIVDYIRELDIEKIKDEAGLSEDN